MHNIKKSGGPEVFCKKGVLKNFANFTGKHLCHGLFFIRAAGLRPATWLKKTLAHVLSCEFCEIFKNTFFYRTPLPFFNIAYERVNSRNNYVPAYNSQQHCFKYSLFTSTLEVQFKSNPEYEKLELNLRL